MNNPRKFPRSSLKIYLIMVSLVMGGVIVLTYFRISPEIIKIVAKESPTEAERIKSQVFNMTVGGLFFIFLINFCFWKIDDKLEKEVKKAQEVLKINPRDPFVQEKLTQIERKRKYYAAVAEPVLIFILGLMVALMAYTILIPLYRSIGTF